MRKRINNGAGSLKGTIGGVEYRWSGGFGAVLVSYENNVKKNEVRAIGDLAFRAYLVERNFFSKNEVWWVPLGDFSMEDVRLIKLDFFGIRLWEYKDEYERIIAEQKANRERKNED